MEEIKIIFPTQIGDKVHDIRILIESLADESDNFPFTSDDMNMPDDILQNFLEFLINSPNSTICLAYKEDCLVGLGFLEGGKKIRTYHLVNLGIGVLKYYNRQGIGSKIMDALIEFSKTSEYIAKIDIIVREDNKNAIKLYKKKGFNLEGKIKRSLFIDGEFYDMLYMGLIID